MKTLAFTLLLSAIAVGAIGCNEQNSPHEAIEPTPQGMIGTLGVSLQSPKGEVQSNARVWYTSSDASASDHNGLVERSRDGNAPASWTDSDGNLWLACADQSRDPANSNWCDMIVLPSCFVGDCTYELRVHRTEPIAQIDDENSWEADTGAWVKGAFTWSDEFVPASEYFNHYPNYTAKEWQDLVGGGATLDIHLEQDSLRTRGWVRRAKEDNGFIVEPYAPLAE